MPTTMMPIIVLLLSRISVILSSLVIIDAPILLTNIDISKSFNRTSFPQGFIFGTASLSYQYEGAENVGGRGPSIWDNSTHKYSEKVEDTSNGLFKDIQSIFLNLVCCFKGYQLTVVQNILCDHDGYNVKDQIKVLIDESIISISGGKETIHDSIEKMAKELVCQESPTEIGKCIRLLLPEDIIYSLKEYKGNSSLRVMEWKAYDMLDEFTMAISVTDDSENSLSLSNANALWRLVGLVSSVVGLLCYAQSPSFNRLIGRWNILKFFLCGVFSLAIFTTILFVKQFSPSTRYAQIKTYTSFAVLMIISVYSFYYDKAVNGKPEILSLVSNAAFALMSLSLSKLIRFGFEIGIFAYFLGCLVVQLWTINWMLILVAIIFGCPLFIMHSSSHSQEEVDTDQIIDESSGSDPEVGNTGQPDVSNESRVIIDSYLDSQQEVTSEGQVIHSSVTIPEVASCKSDQGVVDIIREENSVSVVAS